MSRSSANEAQLSGAAKGLPEHGLIAVAWAGFALAAALVALRSYARLTETKRLYPDDYWMMAALLFLLVNAILQTLQAHSLYYLVFAGAGMVPAGEALLEQGNIYVRYEFVIIALFWTITWSVKSSFLSLYWRLFEGLRTDRMILLAVAAFAALAYVGCWIASVWTCHPPSTYFQFGQCSKPIDTEGSTISISYSTAVDILTDLMIMALPIRMLRRLQVNTRQKASLAGIFSVALIIIAVALVRLSQVISQARTDPVGLAVWGLVESSVAVMVGSLPPLKAFISRTLERTTNRSGNSGSRSKKGYYAEPLEEQSLSKSQTRVESIPLEDRGWPIRPSGGAAHSVEGEVVKEREYY